MSSLRSNYFWLNHNAHQTTIWETTSIPCLYFLICWRHRDIFSDYWRWRQLSAWYLCKPQPPPTPLHPLPPCKWNTAFVSWCIYLHISHVRSWHISDSNIIITHAGGINSMLLPTPAVVHQAPNLPILPLASRTNKDLPASEDDSNNTNIR